jgi:hypothetical protein
MKILGILKSENKFERAEGYCIVVLLVGSIMLSTGIGLTAINPKGFSAILAMLGSLITFLATVALIFIWLAQELLGE